MGVVDVVPGAVGEHRVDEMRLDLGRLRTVARETSCVATGRLVLEVPADAVLLDVPVDQEARRDDRVGVRRAPERDPVFGLDADDLRDGHEGSVPAVPLRPADGIGTRSGVVGARPAFDARPFARNGRSTSKYDRVATANAIASNTAAAIGNQIAAGSASYRRSHGMPWLRIGQCHR